MMWDQMKNSWLINSINKEFVKNVSNCELSSKIWIALESYFNSCSREKIIGFKANIILIEKDGVSRSE